MNTGDMDRYENTTPRSLVQFSSVYWRFRHGRDNVERSPKSRKSE